VTREWGEKPENRWIRQGKGRNIRKGEERGGSLFAAARSTGGEKEEGQKKTDGPKATRKSGPRGARGRKRKRKASGKKRGRPARSSVIAHKRGKKRGLLTQPEKEETM